MYTDIVDIQSISTMAWNKMVSVCGYIRKVLEKYFPQILIQFLFKYYINWLIIVHLDIQINTTEWCTKSDIWS